MKNGEEIRIGPKENVFASDEERISFTWKLRQKLVRTTPITDGTITKLDNWLAVQPEKHRQRMASRAVRVRVFD